MTPARDEAKRTFMHALKALVVEGRPCDWGKVMILLAIPITFSFSLASLLNSTISNLFVPLIWYPILQSMHIENLSRWTMGSVRIGALLEDYTSVGLNVLMLFAFTRFVRRFL